MTYFLLLEGGGGGCDYTIGCNKNWIIIDSPKPLTEEQMQKHLVEACEDYGDDRIESISVLACDSFEMHDVDDIMRISREAELEEERLAIEKKELKTLKALQEKYPEGA